MGIPVEISIAAYLFFAIAYIILFGFILLGLFQLNEATKFIAKKQIFQEKVSSAFRKAGNSFLTFGCGTLIIDIALLAWTSTSSRVLDLLSTELLVFVVLGYLMFFLADVFNEGISLQRDNKHTF